MRKYNNLLPVIFNISLISVGILGLDIIINIHNTYAQTTNSPTIEAASVKPKKNDFERLVSIYSTPVSIIFSTSGIIATYFFNQSWKRRQYIEEKIKIFEDKIEVVNVRKMLNTELQCVELFPFLDKPDERFVIVEDSMWAEALFEGKDNAILRSQFESINKYKDKSDVFSSGDKDILIKSSIKDILIKSSIRDSFNKYLDCLQQFEIMINSQVIKQEELEIYLDPWLNFMDHVNNDIEIESSSKTKTKKYTAKHALLEYMGLWEGQELSVIQKDVKKLVKRFRDSNCSPITTTIKDQI